MMSKLKPYRWFKDWFHWLNIALLLLNLAGACNLFRPNLPLWARISSVLNAICVGYILHDLLYRPMLREGNELVESAMDIGKRALDRSIGRKPITDFKDYFDARDDLM